MSTTSPAQRALNAATLSLVVGGGCAVAFVPPLLEPTLASLPRTALLGIALAVGLLLHWVFLAIGAHRMGRSVAGWVALSVLLFPIGSVASLVLLGFFADEPATAAPTTGR